MIPEATYTTRSYYRERAVMPLTINPMIITQEWAREHARRQIMGMAQQELNEENERLYQEQRRQWERDRRMGIDSVLSIRTTYVPVVGEVTLKSDPMDKLRGPHYSTRTYYCIANVFKRVHPDDVAQLQKVVDDPNYHTYIVPVFDALPVLGYTLPPVVPFVEGPRMLARLSGSKPRGVSGMAGRTGAGTAAEQHRRTVQRQRRRRGQNRG